MKRSGQERSGIMLVLLLFLLSNEQESERMRKKIGEEKQNQCIHVFD